MRHLVRKFLIGTASVLVIGIGGAALDYSPGASDAAKAGNLPSASVASDNLATGAGLWKDDIRWAQVELRDRGLYRGSLDGVVGPQTQRAIEKFQKANHLDRTARLDPETMQTLTGDSGLVEGSSSPPNTDGAISTTDSSGAGN